MHCLPHTRHREALSSHILGGGVNSLCRNLMHININLHLLKYGRATPKRHNKMLTVALSAVTFGVTFTFLFWLLCPLQMSNSEHASISIRGKQMFWYSHRRKTSWPYFSVSHRAWHKAGIALCWMVKCMNLHLKPVGCWGFSWGVWEDIELQRYPWLSHRTASPTWNWPSAKAMGPLPSASVERLPRLCQGEVFLKGL